MVRTCDLTRTVFIKNRYDLLLNRSGREVSFKGRQLSFIMGNRRSGRTTFLIKYMIHCLEEEPLAKAIFIALRRNTIPAIPNDFDPEIRSRFKIFYDSSREKMCGYQADFLFLDNVDFFHTETLNIFFPMMPMANKVVVTSLRPLEEEFSKKFWTYYGLKNFTELERWDG